MSKLVREKLDRLVRFFRVKRCDVPFVILFQGRTGSTHFCELLIQHPQIICRKEDFTSRLVDSPDNDSPDDDSEEVVSSTLQRALLDFDDNVLSQPDSRKVIQHLYDIYSCPAKVCGFKLKHALQTQLFPEIISEFKKIRNLHVITLTRENLIKQAISRENQIRIRKLTGKANLFKRHLQKDEDLPVRFQVDVRRVLRLAQTFKSQRIELTDLASDLARGQNRKLLSINYEDLLFDRDELLNRVFEFLHVQPNVKVEPWIKKATSDNLREAIINIDELHDALAGTEFESMLDD